MGKLLWNNRTNELTLSFNHHNVLGYKWNKKEWGNDMSRIFASVWSIAMVWRMYKQEKKNFYLFFTLLYECHPYKNRPGTHITLRPLNQDENKLMIYVLLNIHEGNPWLMWEKNEKTKMLLMWNLDRIW